MRDDRDNVSLMQIFRMPKPLKRHFDRTREASNYTNCINGRVQCAFEHASRLLVLHEMKHKTECNLVTFKYINCMPINMRRL